MIYVRCLYNSFVTSVEKVAIVKAAQIYFIAFCSSVETIIKFINIDQQLFFIVPRFKARNNREGGHVDRENFPAPSKVIFLLVSFRLRMPLKAAKDHTITVPPLSTVPPITQFFGHRYFIPKLYLKPCHVTNTNSFYLWSFVFNFSRNPFT